MRGKIFCVKRCFVKNTVTVYVCMCVVLMRLSKRRITIYHKISLTFSNHDQSRIEKQQTAITSHEGRSE